MHFSQFSEHFNLVVTLSLHQESLKTAQSLVFLSTTQLILDDTR